MSIRSSRFRSAPLFLLSISGAMLLAACGDIGSSNPGPVTTDPYPVTSILGTGTATLSADVVRSNRGNAVDGSVAYLFKSGDHSTAVAKASTDTKGYVEFAKIPVGSYDLVFMKTNYSGSEVIGATTRAERNVRLKVAQFADGDPNGDVSTPALRLETVDAVNPDGTVKTYKGLTPGSVFNDTVTARASTIKKGDTPRVMRYYLFSLVTIDENGQWADVRPSTGVSTADPGYITPGVGDQAQDSGLVTLDPTGLEGDVYMQVVGLDFNYNRVAYLLPITVKRTTPVATVTAPTGFRAVAYTLSERVGYLYGVTKPDAPSSGANLWVTTSWDAPASLTGIRGFSVLRANTAAGPFTQVAFAGDKQCSTTTKRCTVNDNTATLNSDQDYVYKVVAVGQNSAESAPASTHTLPVFHPQLVSPAKDSHDVDLSPTYTIRNNAFPIGATGAQYELRVEDTLVGQSFAYAAKRLIFRKGLDATGKIENQVLSNLTGTSLYYVYRDSNKAADNSVSYDASTDLLGIPHQFEEDAPKPLQTNRVYSWYLNKAFAYRLLDPAKAQSAANYVSAYSVYSDPDSAALIVPGGVRQQYTDVNDFTTRK